MPLIECENCEAKVDANVITTHVAPITREDDYYAYQFEVHQANEQRLHRVKASVSPSQVYALLTCPSCEDVILGYRYDFEDESTFARLWPSVRRGHYQLPPDIRTSFDEALTCLKCRAFLACVLMCRRVLETTCRHHYPDTRTLAQGLEKLHQGRVIDARLFEWAEALRRAGNLSAHEPTAKVAREDAVDLVDFTEAILNYVFVLSKRFEDFQQRHSQRARDEAE